MTNRHLIPSSSFAVLRRGVAVACALAAAVAGAISPASAQQRAPGGGAAAGGVPDVVISDATMKPIPIAIPELLGDDPRLAADVAGVIAADLKNSGRFEPLDRAAFLEKIRDMNAAPRFADWRAVRADGLVVGKVGRGPDGRLGAEFRLWDVAQGKQLAGQRFATSPQNWRRIGHMIADVVYERMLGEKGYFDTRVVYVDETGPKDRRTKRLAIMDQDGFNVRLLTQGHEIVLTPRFSPVAQEITFMTYAKGQTRVFVMNLESGQRNLVGEFPQGVNTFAPRFTPDGSRIVFSLEEQGTTSIYELDLRSRQTRRLTQPPVGRIDTGPSYSPDGRQIAFESDRDGTQQIFVMNADGSGVHRISNGGDGRYSTPVWSPRGDYVAFTKQMSGRFLIGVFKPDGSGERILTEGYHNEGPTWAPNGRVVMFFRESQGANGGPRIYSVDITGYNERPIATPSYGSDPAWSPLLN